MRRLLAAIIGLALNAAVASAQSSAAAPKFEVASVRLTTPFSQFMLDNQAALQNGQRPAPNGVMYSGARITISGLNLKSVIANAYRTEMYRLDAPAWTQEARVVIQALMPPGTSKGQVPEMLKALLSERFHLVAHSVMRQEPAFALVIAKANPKLNPPRELDNSACANWSDDHSYSGGQMCNSVQQVGGRSVRILMGTSGIFGPMRADFTSPDDVSDGNVRTEYLKITMRQLAQRLSVPCGDSGTCAGLPVVDRTGIEGAWDVVLEGTCSRGRGGEGCSTDAEMLQKIGLRLEKTTAPIERIVVDQIDKVPTEN